MSQEILQFFLRADFFEEHSIIKVVSCVWSGVIICLSLASMVESIMGLRGNSLPLWLLQLRIRYYMYALLTREPSITISSFRCTYIHFIIFSVGSQEKATLEFGLENVFQLFHMPKFHIFTSLSLFSFFLFLSLYVYI